MPADERTPLLEGTQLAGAAAPRVLAESDLHDHPRDEEFDASHETPSLPFRTVALACTALWMVTFICSLDTTVVAMLLGPISASFYSSEKASWIGSTYLLSVCATSSLYGRLCDIIGGKRALTISISFFTLGTFWCGRAMSMNEFLAARTLAGIGGGGLSTVGSVIMSHMVPLHQRGVYQGLTNVMWGMGIAVGGPVGGILNDTIGWRGTFYIQLPLLVIAFVALNYLLPQDEPTYDSDATSPWGRLKDVDFYGLGVVTLVPLSLLYVLDLISVKDVAFSDWRVVAGVTVSFVALVAFYFVERYVSRVPLISLDVLALRSAWASLVSNLFVAAATFAYNYNFPLYFQTVAQMPPSTIGVRMIPASITLSIGSLVAGIYMKQTLRYYWYNAWCIIMVVLAVSRTLFYYVDPPTVSPFVYNAFISFGGAGMLTCTLLALINSVEKHSIGVSTGMSYFFRTSGQVYGVAFSGGILQMTLVHELRQRIVGPEAEELIAKIRHESTAIATLPEPFRAAAIESYAGALHNVFVFVFVGYVGAMVFSLMLENKPLPVPEKPRDEERT